MYKFTFVVLHYKTLQDTIECVDSILYSVKYENYYIVIVDNGSNDNSGVILKKRYENNSNVVVLINEINLGFAKGNNIGFNYAKYLLKSDFIALLNNDTYIKQPEFISLIIAKYDKFKFDVIGPDVISPIDNSHQNPRRLTLKNKNRLKKLILHHQLLLVLNYFLIDFLMEKIKKFFLPKAFLSNDNPQYLNHFQEQVNVKLSGCCLIFSPNFISSYDGLFEKTFLYSEEEILYYICKRDDKKTFYFPDAKIFHKEDSTVNYLYKSSLIKRRFYYKNFIKSGKVFVELINDDNKLENWDD